MYSDFGEFENAQPMLSKKRNAVNLGYSNKLIDFDSSGVPDSGDKYEPKLNTEVMNQSNNPIDSHQRSMSGHESYINTLKDQPVHLVGESSITSTRNIPSQMKQQTSMSSMNSSLQYTLKPLLYSLYIDIVLSSSPNASTSSLKKFLQVFKWTLNGSITQSDFSTLYQMWMKSGKKEKTKSQNPSEHVTPIVSFSEFCFIMKDWSEQQLDIMLGTLTQECNENLLKISTMSELEFNETNYMFGGIPNVYSNRQLCNIQWIEAVEKIFLSLDTLCIGCWDLDRVLIFLMSLLNESDKKQLSARDLLQRSKEFMDSVVAVGGLVSLKCFKLFFLQNGLNIDTITSSGKCLQKEIDLYNRIAGSDDRTEASILKEALMWQKSIRFAFSIQQHHPMEFDSGPLHRFLECDCDHIRFLNISNYFSKKHAAELSRSYMMKGGISRHLKGHVDEIIVTVLIVYKQLLQRVIDASSGDSKIQYLVNESELLSILGRTNSESMQYDANSIKTNNVKQSYGTEFRNIPPIPQENTIPNSFQITPQPVQDEWIQNGKNTSQINSEPFSHISTKKESNRNLPEPSTKISNHPKDEIAEIPVSQPISNPENYNVHSNLIHESPHPSQQSLDIHPQSQVSSYQDQQNPPKDQSHRHYKQNNAEDSRKWNNYEEYDRRTESIQSETTQSYNHKSDNIAMDISEISSLDEDISIIPLSLDMESRIRSAAWVDIKFENIDKFKYLPVRSGANFPRPSKLLMETDSEINEKSKKKRKKKRVSAAESRRPTPEKRAPTPVDIEHQPITDGLSENSDLEFEKRKEMKNHKHRRKPPTIHVNSKEFQSMLRVTDPNSHLESQSIDNGEAIENLTEHLSNNSNAQKSQSENKQIQKRSSPSKINSNQSPPKSPKGKLLAEAKASKPSRGWRSPLRWVSRKSKSQKISKEKILKSSIIEKDRPPSPERELIDHLSLDGDVDDLNFNAGDITPASLKHMLELTRSNKAQRYSRGNRHHAPNKFPVTKPVEPTVSNSQVMENNSSISLQSNPTIREPALNANMGKSSPVDKHTSSQKKPLKTKQAKRGYTSAYPGAQGEPNKEIQLPSLPKSYYKQISTARMNSSKSHDVEKEKPMWKV